jgi:hypothetical protein
MSMPAGLAMADRAPDRDGLKLDQLHVPLGPILPDWPAGLILHTILQGDVIQQAEVEVVDAGVAGESSPPGSLPFWDEPWLRALAGERVTRGAAARRRAAAHLDSLGRLLAVAGWVDAALATRRLRDDLLAGLDPPAASARFTRLARRLRRSRILRCLTNRLGVLDPGLAAAHGLGGPAGRATGDVTARWLGWRCRKPRRRSTAPVPTTRWRPREDGKGRAAPSAGVRHRPGHSWSCSPGWW